jgi:hypothetical protein
MKIGQIYENGAGWFMILKEIINEERHSSKWPDMELVVHGWLVSEVWPNTMDCGLWHDTFQEWTDDEISRVMQKAVLVKEPMILDDVFIKHPKQVIEE